METNDLILMAIAVVAIAVVITPFLIAKTNTMRSFLAGVLLFGILCGVVEQYIRWGHLNAPIIVILGGGIGWAAIYLVIATFIVHPWRRRESGKRPAYIACSVVLAIFTITSLGGEYTSQLTHSTSRP
jgi:hypothetical protein